MLHKVQGTCKNKYNWVFDSDSDSCLGFELETPLIIQFLSYLWVSGPVPAAKTHGKHGFGFWIYLNLLIKTRETC